MFRAKTVRGKAARGTPSSAIRTDREYEKDPKFLIVDLYYILNYTSEFILPKVRESLARSLLWSLTGVVEYNDATSSGRSRTYIKGQRARDGRNRAMPWL
jgi:hypothetical protein